MANPRILIACIGNIFLGDDAFGVEVAKRLAQRELPHDARLVDFGIRGIDLTYALLDGYETVILVDAVPRGEQPGTLYVIEPEPGAAEAEGVPPGMLLDTHGMDPAKVLRVAKAMGSPVERILLVGCEPSPDTGNDAMAMQLSEPVSRAVEEAVEMVETLVARLLANEKQTTIPAEVQR